MEGKRAMLSILPIFLLLLVTSPFADCRKKRLREPCKNLVLYFHDIIYNGQNMDNATSAIVAAPVWANRTILAGLMHFGDIVVFDDPITLDNNLHSMPVGRAQVKLWDKFVSNDGVKGVAGSQAIGRRSNSGFGSVASIHAVAEGFHPIEAAGERTGTTNETSTGGKYVAEDSTSLRCFNAIVEQTAAASGYSGMEMVQVIDHVDTSGGGGGSNRGNPFVYGKELVILEYI